MRRPTKRHLEIEISRLLTSDEVEEAQAFVSKLKTWLEANRDGRGLAAKAIKEGYYSCVQFRQALGARSHKNSSSIRRQAAKVVKATRHDNFQQLQSRLRSLHGEISVYGKRRAEKRRETAARTIRIDERFELRELCSIPSVRRIGRTLKNCVARQSWARLYLQDSDCELWAVYDMASKRPLYLVKVDRSTNEIDEFEGYDNSTPELERTFVWNVLRVLGVSGDNNEAVARTGAFHAFLDGKPDVEPVRTGSHMHWIWVFRGGAEIIIATRTQPGGGKRWSRFLRTGASEIDSSFWNHLSEEKLLCLLLDHPWLAERVRHNTVNQGSVDHWW